MRSQHVGDLTPSTSFPKAAKATAKQSECIGTWSQLSTNITSPQAQNAIVVPTKVHPMLPRCWWCLSAILSVSRLASCLVGTLPVECHWITFAQRRLESLEWYPDIRFWRLLRRGCQARPRDHGLKSFRKPKSPDVFDHSNQCLGYVTEMKEVKTYGTGQRTPRINAA